MVAQAQADDGTPASLKNSDPRCAKAYAIASVSVDPFKTGDSDTTTTDVNLAYTGNLASVARFPMQVCAQSYHVNRKQSRDARIIKASRR